MSHVSMQLRISGLDKAHNVLAYQVNFTETFALNTITLQISFHTTSCSPYFLEWLSDPASHRDIDISITKKLVSLIKIREAFLLSYVEERGTYGTTEVSLVFSPQSLEINGVTYNRNHYL